MKRDFSFKGIDFHIGGYTPRKNEYEKGLKYGLFVGDICYGHFTTIHEARNYAFKNYFIWL